MNGPVLLLLTLCLITAALAARKGYNFFLWFLAGGIIGLIFLAFLPFVNEGGLSEAEVREKTKTGNMIGGVFTALALAVLVPRLLIVLAVSTTPKMSGVNINGHDLTQREWDACNHDMVTCFNMHPDYINRK